MVELQNKAARVARVGKVSGEVEGARPLGQRRESWLDGLVGSSERTDTCVAS